MPVIVIDHLTKVYGNQTVLDDVNLVLESGSIYGLVGRNGSGKTMLLKHICGFVRPTSGFISIDGKIIGKDVDIPENMGIIIEMPGFLVNYTGFQNLRILAKIRNRIDNRHIEDTIKLVGLDPSSKKKVGKYSMGMRQRLGLAQALMEDPDVLLLDEPMNGLDNEGVAEMRSILLAQKEKGKLIVVASHNQEDIDLLCDEIYRFDKGRIIETNVTAP